MRSKSNKISRAGELIGKLIRKVSKKDRLSATLMIFTIFLSIQAVTLTISLLYRIIATYFQHYLVYFVMLLISLYWLGILGVVILIVYLGSKKPETAAKVIGSVFVIYLTWVAISMATGFYRYPDETYILLPLATFLIFLYLSSAFSEIGIFEAPTVVYFVFFVFSLESMLNHYRHDIFLYILFSTLTYSAIALMIAAYHKKVARPKNAPKIVVSISILMIYYNIFSLIFSNESMRSLTIGIALLLVSFSLLLLNYLNRRGCLRLNLKTKPENLRLRYLRYLYYLYYLTLSYIYILAATIVVMYIASNHGTLSGLLVAETLALIGLLISPLSYTRTILNILGSLIGCTLIFHAVTSYLEYAYHILLSVIAITFLSTNLLKREMVIIEVLATFSGIAAIYLFMTMHFLQFQLDSIASFLIFLSLSVAFWIYSLYLEFPKYAPKILFVLSATIAEVFPLYTIGNLSIPLHALATLTIIIVLFASLKFISGNGSDISSESR